MLYLLAAIGALSLAVVLWRAFGTGRIEVSPHRSSAPVAPDDDPEFLRKLSEEQKKQDGEGTD